MAKLADLTSDDAYLPRMGETRPHFESTEDYLATYLYGEDDRDIQQAAVWFARYVTWLADIKETVSPEALAQAFWDMVKPDGAWWGEVLAAHDLPVPEGW